MVVTSNRSRSTATERGMVLMPRDEAILRSLWEMRTMTRAQIQRLHFGGPTGTQGALAATVSMRRLTLLTSHAYLVARRMPVQRKGGSSPYVYSLGPRSVPLLAERLGLDTKHVTRRQRQDARLAWMFFEHRQAITDVWIAFQVACHQQGFRLWWRDDEEVARDGEHVVVAGEAYPIRPDGFFVIDGGETGTRSVYILEVQLASDPQKFRRKAQAYMAYWSSGAYTSHFGFRSLRVLTVVDTSTRAVHLKQAAESVGGATLFWSAALGDVIRDPFDVHWYVGGTGVRQRLFDGKEYGTEVIAAANRAI